MADLSDEDRAELARLRERFDGVEVEPREPITGEFAPVEPMLATALDGSLSALREADWLAERKFDGTRLVVEKFDDEIRAYTRRGIDRYEKIPGVHPALDRLPNDLVLDGELTFLDADGTSQFVPLHTDAERIAARDLTPVYVAFDLLYDGEDRCGRSLLERRELLEDHIVDGDHLRRSRARKADFQEFFDDVTAAGEEGIMLKRRDSQYYPGVRSAQWRKVKQFTERDAIVVGYTEGDGSRAESFGALVLTDGERYVGRVGTGFSEAELRDLTARMRPVDERQVAAEQVGRAYTPVEPFVVTVTYQEVTDDGKLRAPVFQREHTEKPVSDVQPIA